MPTEAKWDQTGPRIPPSHGKSKFPGAGELGERRGEGGRDSSEGQKVNPASPLEIPIFRLARVRRIFLHVIYERKTHSRPLALPLVFCWWLTSVILATQEAEIRRMMVQSLPGK
jgi:hypothetical protein